MIGLEKISKHGKDEIRIISEVASNYDDIIAIYLFGSCARNQDTESSDIDTLIIWNNYEYDSNFGEKSFNFVKDVFDNKRFRWDRLFLNSEEELKSKDYGVYKNIVDLNYVIYKKESN